MRLFQLRSWSMGSSSSSNEDEEENSKDNGNKALLYLNVYDLTHFNSYLYWFGLGIFHSGIEAHGMEYGFGAHEFATSGVFEVEPKSCPGFIFRRSVLLGSTNLSRSELCLFMKKLSVNYHGDTYHLIAKNCNHFTDDVSKQLTGKSIPGWVNRLARIGSFCNCLLPESIQLTALKHLPDHLDFSDNDELESHDTSVTAGSEDEDSSHHLLTSPTGDLPFFKDKPVKLAKELM